MKLGFSTFACPEWSLKQVLHAAVQHGYQGVEFRIDARHNHGLEVYTSRPDRHDIASQLSSEGIEPCCLATSLQFARDQVLDDVPARVELAAEIGCPALRVLCGPMPGGMNMQELTAKVASQLRIAADIAEQAGVQLWLETHDTMCAGVDAAAAVRQADHTFIGISYNNIHPFRNGESLELTFAALNGLIRHCHFHDALNNLDKVVIRPIGWGEMPIDQTFDALFKMGFDNYLCGEWFHDQYGRDPESSLQLYYSDITGLMKRHGAALAH